MDLQEYSQQFHQRASRLPSSFRKDIEAYFQQDPAKVMELGTPVQALFHMLKDEIGFKEKKVNDKNRDSGNLGVFIRVAFLFIEWSYLPEKSKNRMRTRIVAVLLVIAILAFFGSVSTAWLVGKLFRAIISGFRFFGSGAFWLFVLILIGLTVGLKVLMTAVKRELIYSITHTLSPIARFQQYQTCSAYSEYLRKKYQPRSRRRAAALPAKNA